VLSIVEEDCVCACEDCAVTAVGVEGGGAIELAGVAEFGRRWVGDGGCCELGVDVPPRP
jgi:hypothetical protein